MRKVLLFLFCIFTAACSEDIENVVSGTLVMGHEVRAFTADGQDKEYWVIDKSGDLYKKYQEVAPIDAGAYVPVRAELKVKELPKMQDGFGAEYDGTYEVVEIISVEKTEK